METKQDAKPLKSKAPQVSTVPVRVKRETKKRLLTELAKVNKKTFGKKVHLDDLVALLLGLLTEQHVMQLQETSLSNADRLEIAYNAYVKAHGAITKDAFLGKLMGGEIAAPGTAPSTRSSTQVG